MLKVQNLVRALIAAGACLIGNVGAAGPYPDHPIRLIVPFEAGGPTDVLARLLGPKLNAELGQPVIIENKAGAGSAIGISQAARSAADGYTYVVAGSAYAINASFMPSLPYDTLRDLKGVAPFATTPFFLVVRNDLPVKDVNELVALAKKSPGKLTYASSGTGNSPHLAGALFAQRAGIELLHVPYKGTGPAVTALLGGMVDMIFTGLPSVGSHVQAGQLRILAVAGDESVPFAPGVKTFKDAGLAGINADAWFGVLAPANVPQDRAERFAKALGAAVRDPDVVSRFADLGAVPTHMDLSEFQNYINSDVKRWADFFLHHPDIVSR